MSNDVTFDQFEKTVFEFSKALAVNDNNGNTAKRISEKARKLAKDWYKDKDAREESFQELLADLDGEAESPEPKKQSYGSALPRTS